jgi:hypothetical protein
LYEGFAATAIERGSAKAADPGRRFSRVNDSLQKICHPDRSGGFCGSLTSI